jgi:hypothetical protein
MSDTTPARIMDIGLGFWASRTVLSGVDLGVFGALAAGPADLATLTAKLGLHDRSARDFLDALVALKLLERDHGLYRNAEDAEFFLDPAKPAYVGGLLEMASARLYGFWGSLTEGLRTGQPQSEAKQGGNFFAAVFADPARLRGFLRAMSGLSAGVAVALSEKFDWAGYATSWTLARRRGWCPSLSPAPIHTSPPSASTCRRCNQCSRNSSPSRVSPAVCGFVLGTSLSKPFLRLM